MTVEQMIEKLKQLNPAGKVFIYDEDKDINYPVKCIEGDENSVVLW